MPSKLRNTLPFLLAFILALVLIPGVARADDALDSVEGVEATEPLELVDETEPTDPAAPAEEALPAETDVVLEETVPAETDVVIEETVPAEEEVVAPVLGTRAVTYVAEVDNVKYATIEEAVSHTRNGSTIKLLADCTASSTLNITNSVTIDTNGFTLSNGFEASGSRKPLIKVTGALDVVGTGTISSTSKNVSAIEVHDAGCLHVGDGVTISGSDEAIGMFSTGYVIIAGGNVTAGGSAIYAVLHNNTGCQIKIYRGTLTNTSAYSPVVDIYGPNSTFEMRGGTITGGIGVQTSSSGVTADIYDGTINATLYGVYCLYGDSPFTIRGGSITGGRACICTPDDYPWSYDLSVTGGTFSGPIDVTNCNHFVSGGTFDTTVPSKYLATGCTQNAGGEVIVDLDTYPVFLIHNGNKTPMTSLAGAVAAAQSGDSVVLRKDLQQDDPITISEKRVTLDLAGFALTGSGTDRYLFCATGSGTLTVTDSSANRTGSISFSSSTSGGSGYVAALRADGGTIAVEGGTVSGSPYGIVTQGTGSSVAVSNAAVTGTMDGIHVGSVPTDTASISVGEGALVQGQGNSSCGIGIGTGTVELTMTGGKVTGFQGINQAQGTLAFTMSGGTVEGTFSTTGAQLAAIALKGTSTIDISGGTVTGTSAVLLTPSFSSDTCTPSISGGDFYGTVSSSASGFVTGGTFDALDDAYVAEGYFKEPIDGGRVEIIDVRGLGAAIGTADEVLDTYKPVTTDPLDIPEGTRYLPEDAYAALQDARDAASEVYGAPQSQEQINEATEALETAVSTAQGKIVTHMVDRSAYNKVAQDFMSLIIETKVSDDGKTYRVDNETTAPLEDGDEYFIYEEALRIWEAFLQTNQAYNTATTQRQVDAATAAARTALSALIAAKKTYVASIPMHRLYNPYTGEHLYTASTSERDHLASIGWNYEGIGWDAPASGVPVYRLYNPNAPGGDHHYTMDKSEYEHLQAVGWSGEGICWYSDPNKSVPVYREYNPNEFAHNHNYTASRAEHDHLVSIGWNDEGIGWYGV